MSEDFKNGFRQGMLCVDRFWDNIDLYSDNPILQRLDPLTTRELRRSMKNWLNRYMEAMENNES